MPARPFDTLRVIFRSLLVPLTWLFLAGGTEGAKLRGEHGHAGCGVGLCSSTCQRL